MKFKLYIYFFTTIIFLYIPNALAGITQSKPNIYICDLSNALLLIQFNDISGHLVGDYRSATLPTGGTSEQITDQPFSGFEHDGAISITFQDGTNWIGKVNGQHLDFMIPHFIIGEPLSTVVFKSSTAKAYDRQQMRMVDTINHNVMINRERANVLATMKKSKHTADQISYDYKKLSRLESIKILTPETVIEKYKKQIILAKKMISMQLNLKNGPNFYGKNYKINSLNYNVNSIADNVDSINDGLFQIYNNAKNIETGIKNDILSISRNCTLYRRLMPIYQNHDTSALCDNERKRLNFAELHSKYIKNSVSGIKNEQIKYNAIMKSLQAQSQSIK